MHRYLHDPLGGICVGDQAEGRTDQAIVWRRVAGNIESIKGFSAQLEGLLSVTLNILNAERSTWRYPGARSEPSLAFPNVLNDSVP